MLEKKDFSSPVGLVAGNGTFPLEFIKNAHEAGLKVVVSGINGETSAEVAAVADFYQELKVGQIGKAIKFFTSHKVKQVAFAGGVRRVRLFGGVKLDFKAIAILARCRSIRDDALLRAIAQEFENSGLTVFAASMFLERSLSAHGLLTRRALTFQEQEDARIGWEIAKELGRLDIGQTVVIHQKLVVALEAIEGTDAAILRAGALAGTDKRKKVGQGCVIVKLSKPQQDLRLDLPTIGLGTIESASKAGVSAIVVEAGKSVLLDPEEFVKKANENQIAVFMAKDISEI